MSESQGQRTVPVFSYRVGPSFSSDSEPLLLDRFHQAVSYEHMVLAVESPEIGSRITRAATGRRYPQEQLTLDPQH